MAGARVNPWSGAEGMRKSRAETALAGGGAWGVIGISYTALRRLTAADGACRMRPVGVETDIQSPCPSFRPGRESGVSTGRMVKGFVVSAPAVRAR